MICFPEISAADSGVGEVLTNTDEDLSESWCLGLNDFHQLPVVFVREYGHA